MLQPTAIVAMKSYQGLLSSIELFVLLLAVLESQQ